MPLSISLSTPPTQLTEKMMRPPVVASNISKIFSRSRQLCMNRLSKPMASASRPSQSRWLWMRLISIQIVRRYAARRGTSTPMMCSTLWQ